MMMVLITYDVSTEDNAGKTRLRKVAKECVNYGQRVQNSVFECLLDASQALLLKKHLLELIDLEKDSLRFYYIGNNYRDKIEYYGAKTSYDPEAVIDDLIASATVVLTKSVRGLAPAFGRFCYGDVGGVCC